MASRRRLGWVLAAGLCHAAGCKGNCLDDGAVFKQSLEACMAASATDSATEGTGSDTEATGSATMGAPTEGSASQGSASQGSASEGSNSITGGDGGLWCEDKDMDGFGDPTRCVPAQPGEDPPGGHAPNDGDCADDDPNTFPGAAPHDDPDACMTDVDGDDWGEGTPHPGVEPGTDCDDGDAATFPGAAEIEDPAACMKDEDDDGWGDSSVGDGVVVGSDCYDSNPDLNPGDRVLFTALDNGDFAAIDVSTGAIDVFASVDIAPLSGPYAVITCATSPTDGRTYCSQSAKRVLVVVDYCSGDTPIELADHGRSICGLGFLDDGTLYGVDSGADELVTFDPVSGDVVDARPITLDGDGVNIQACGMAVDCVTSRMLVTDGQQSRVLSVDPLTGEAAVVADVPEGPWSSVGLEYDPVSKQVLSNDGDELFQIRLDGSNEYTQLADLAFGVNDLAYGPTCG